MIVSKVIEFSIEDLSSVILDLADEINKGYKVHSIERLPPSQCPVGHHFQPCAKITLISKEYYNAR